MKSPLVIVLRQLRPPSFDFDQIPGAAECIRVVLSGARGPAPMPASLFGYFFGMITVLTGAVVLLTGLPNISTIGNGRHYPRPAIARTVTVELQRHSRVAKASPAKDVSPVVSTAKADTKQIKHYKPKVLARQRNNYGYGNARGYASGYGPSSLFFR
jgi:hypothetical protein